MFSSDPNYLVRLSSTLWLSYWLFCKTKPIFKTTFYAFLISLPKRCWEALNSSAGQHQIQPICDSDFLKITSTLQILSGHILFSGSAASCPPLHTRISPRLQTRFSILFLNLLLPWCLHAFQQAMKTIILGLSFLQSIKVVVGRGPSTYHKTEGGIRCSSLQVALLSEGRRLR